MTRHPPSTPPHQDALHHWVDERLPAPDAQDCLAQADASTRDTLLHWRQQRQALQTLHQEVLQEPIPASLLEAATQASAQRVRAANQWRWTGMVATLVMAFGLGWLTRAQLPGPQSVVQADSGASTAFVRAAGFAHAVYQPEKRHPVEVGAAEQEHLVQWLSKRLGRTLQVPDLRAQGFALVGGRLLPGEGSARAQFMFEDTQGRRVTLYLGGLTPTEAQAGQRTGLAQTRFQFETTGTTSSFYWFDQNFGYALSGQMARDQLLTLASLVYQQLP